MKRSASNKAQLIDLSSNILVASLVVTCAEDAVLVLVEVPVEDLEVRVVIDELVVVEVDVDVANSEIVEVTPLAIEVVPLRFTVLFPELEELPPLPITPSPIYEKLAQAILVVLAKCKTNDRLPKKEPTPGCNDTYGSW